MKGLIIGFYTCLFAIAGITTPAFSAEQKAEIAAHIIKIEGTGTARVRRAAGVESVAGVQQNLFAGDKLTTDAASIVELTLIDGSLIRVGLNSEYKLESATQRGGMVAWVFQLAKGSIRALVEKSSDKKSVKFRVNTPVGTMGVRGTELLLEHNEKTKVTTLYTIEGRVQFGALKCDSKKTCIEVTSGQTASIGAGQPNAETAKPTNVSELFLQGNPSAEERLARAALFQDLRKADAFAAQLAPNSGQEIVAKGGLEEMLKRASDEIAKAQNAAIGRTQEQKEKIHAAMDNGTLEKRFKLTEKFDDLQAKKEGKSMKRPSERDLENLFAKNVLAKFAVSEAILRTPKVTATMKANNANWEEMLRRVDEISGEPAKAEAPVTQVTEKLDAQLVEKILSDKTVITAYHNYIQESSCLSPRCDHMTGTAIKEAATTERKMVVQRGNDCFETKEVCNRKMTPCAGNALPSCKPTFSEYACTKQQVKVVCPTEYQGGHNSR